MANLEDCGPLLLPTVTGLGPATARVIWDSMPRATGFVLRWTPQPTGNLRGNDRIAAPPAREGRFPGGGDPADEAPTRRPGGQREVQLPRGAVTATLDGLEAGRTYDLQFCKQCPDGSEECYSWSYAFDGPEDACLDNLTVTRTDSTATSLTLNWTVSGSGPTPDSMTLRWVPVSQDEPARSVTLAYGSGTYTAAGLTPEVAYQFELCAACAPDLPLCRDLGVFGGCRAAYAPELTDLDRGNALLSWLVAADSVRATRLRYRRRSFPGWRDRTVGELRHFRAADYGLLPAQTAEIGQLRRNLVYVAEIQTQCADSTWSEFSEPVSFSLNCSATDSLQLVALTDSTATIGSRPYPAARAYFFEYRPAGTTDWTALPATPGPTAQLTGLLPETDYEARLRFRCRADVLSDYTPVLVFRTAPFCGLPTDQLVDSLSHDFAALSWTPDTHALHTNLRFRRVVTRRGAGRGLVRPWRTVTGLTASHLLDQLRNGQTYEYTLRSVCAQTTGARTQVQRFTLDCAPPGLLTVGTPTPHTAPVRVSDLPGGGGRITVEYRVEGEGGEWLTAVLDDSTTVLTDLRDLTWYEARAYTDCSGGQRSVPTEPVRFQTPVDCRVPDSLHVTAATTTTADLVWARTGTISEWEVRYRRIRTIGEQPTAASAATLSLDRSPQLGADGPVRGDTAPAPPPDPYRNWTTVTVTDPSIVLQQLDPHSVYRVVIRASCPTFGWTDYSEVTELTTLCPAAAPAALVATEIRRRELLISWTPSRCAEEYQVNLESLYPLSTGIDAERANQQLRMDRGPAPPAAPPEIYRDSLRTESSSVRFTGLRPNTEYRVRIKALATDFGFVAGPPHGLEPAWTDPGEWFVFRTDECGRPHDVTDEQTGRSEFLISWTPTNGRNDYLLEYKLRDEVTAGWQEVRTTESSVRITDVLRGQIYDYRVTEECIDGDRFTSQPDSFLVERVSLNNGLYICGITTDVDLSNQVPLSVLEKDDTIMAFDFKMVITEASGGNGRFTGKGELRVPYFNMAKMAFDFNNIFVNDEYRMVDGYLGATGFGVEVLPPWADSLLVVVLEGLQYLDAQAQEQQLQTLDSLLQCCANAFPPWLQTEVQNVLDCYAAAEAVAEQQNLDDPDDAHCDALLDSLMTHILTDLDSISDDIGDQILVSRTCDLIRLALEELDSLHTPGYPAVVGAYEGARGVFTTNYPTLPITPGSGNTPPSDDIIVEETIIQDGLDAGPPSAANQAYQAAATTLREKALERVLYDLYTTTHERRDNHAEIQEFALPLRPGGVDVYTPVFQAVSGGEISDEVIVEQAKDLIVQKFTFLLNN